MNLNDSEFLFNEIHIKLNKDRERLEKYYEKLLSTIQNGDPELMVEASDGVAKLTAELTRVNQQLIEIAKLKLKKDLITMANKGIDDEDRESIFDDLGENLGDN